MTKNMKWAALIISAALVLLIAWMLRYSVITPNGELAGLYVLDRWTGEVQYCMNLVCGPFKYSN